MTAALRTIDRYPRAYDEALNRDGRYTSARDTNDARQVGYDFRPDPARVPFNPVWLFISGFAVIGVLAGAIAGAA